MTTISITESLIPDLKGKVALITGGASGIGLAAVKLLLGKNATVHIIDLIEPDDEEEWRDWEDFHFHQADVRVWNEMYDIFEKIGPIDFAFANAGSGGLEDDLLDDRFDASGRLCEPSFREIDTNVRGVLNTVKLAWFHMRKHKREGSIVLTCASTGYWPDYQVPVFAASAAAHGGIIRSLRNVLPRDGITINGVAAGATITKMMPYDFAVPLINQGLPVSSAETIALALVYSAIARQARRVEVHGSEPQERLQTEGRWNGRMILALGDKFRELEEILCDSREIWFGKQFAKWTRKQQAATDFRRLGSENSGESANE